MSAGLLLVHGMARWSMALSLAPYSESMNQNLTVGFINNTPGILKYVYIILFINRLYENIKIYL